MELKIGENKRIRISQGEYDQLKLGNHLRQIFSLTESIHFEIEIFPNRDFTGQRRVDVETRLCLYLTTGEVDSLGSCQNLKNGVKIDDFIIQLDVQDFRKRKKQKEENTDVESI